MKSRSAPNFQLLIREVPALLKIKYQNRTFRWIQCTECSVNFWGSPRGAVFYCSEDCAEDGTARLRSARQKRYRNKLKESQQS